ncbi:hypothetical protein IFM89_016806 [Coptis chinensis]|uniref:Uncharacterized protein n=1 Tax=Coptis chinensis TaxID=261450 RepID=A0A835MII3_9MAGN|nr:hypothetical protein IFM89_016806 [Coptis chinensis]
MMELAKLLDSAPTIPVEESLEEPSAKSMFCSNLVEKKDLAWERYYDISSVEIGELIPFAMERDRDWERKFGKCVGMKVVELTGETATGN